MHEVADGWVFVATVTDRERDALAGDPLPDDDGALRHAVTHRARLRPSRALLAEFGDEDGDVGRVVNAGVVFPRGDER